MLFGCSDGLSVESEHLTAVECLELLLKAERNNPNAIHVIFSGNYDVVKILESWPTEIHELLYRGKTVEYLGYRVTYIPGKIFRVTKDNITVTLYDVFSFFGCSFVKALRQYLGEIPELEHIIAGKESRGTFEFSQLNTSIKPYWQTELKLLVTLCQTLRESLARIGIHPTAWHGPGAVANTLLRTYGVSNHLSNYERSADLQHTLQCSYFGGRFEQFRAGYRDKETYQYDINSAYPWAAAIMPDLHNATWSRGHTSGNIDPFSLYRITFNLERSYLNDPDVPGPLPYRNDKDCVYFPHRIFSGWYRGVEILNLIEWFEPSCYEILDAWEFHPHSDYRPFAFLEGIYKRRLEYKLDKNPTEYACKIAMNSVYGKTVQHIGYDPAKDNIPQWHQLEYGSFITAACRAKLYNALMASYMADPNSLIASETDALFVTQPLGLPTSDNLGEWKATQYDSILYIQNGVYWTDNELGKAKTRGIEAGNITFQSAMEYLKHPFSTQLTSLSHRFGGMGQHRGKPTLGQWYDQTREIRIPLYTESKRGYKPTGREDDFTKALISLAPADVGYNQSQPYKLPWIHSESNIFRSERSESIEQPTLF